MLSELSKTDNEAKQALIRQDTTDMNLFILIPNRFATRQLSCFWTILNAEAKSMKSRFAIKVLKARYSSA